MKVGEIWEAKVDSDQDWNKVIQVKIIKIVNNNVTSFVVRNDATSNSKYAVRKEYPVNIYYSSAFRKTTCFECDFILCSRNKDYLPFPGQRGLNEDANFVCFICRDFDSK